MNHRLRGVGAGAAKLGVAAALAYLAAVAWLVWWVLVAAVVPSWTPVVITSGSMSPAVRTGDVVVAAEVEPSAVGPGAVVVFRDGASGLVTHRVVSVEGDGAYRTKGDANRVVDSSPVAANAVIGRGRLLVPVVGTPLVWVHHGRWGALAGLAALTVGAAIAVVAWWRGEAPPSPRPDSPLPTEREQALIAFAWGGHRDGGCVVTGGAS